jgi:hypothetical protein
MSAYKQSIVVRKCSAVCTAIRRAKLSCAYANLSSDAAIRKFTGVLDVL